MPTRPTILIFARMSRDIQHDDELVRAVKSREAVLATNMYNARGMIPERIIVVSKPAGIEHWELDQEIEVYRAHGTIEVEYR